MSLIIPLTFMDERDFSFWIFFVIQFDEPARK